jgi:putative copper resistance protein D
MAPNLVALAWHAWQPAWGLDTLAALAASAYLCGVSLVRRWPRRRTLSFLAGIACVLVALQSGVGTFDDRMLSDHMVQHLLLLELAPLLLLAGQPVMLLVRAAPRDARATAARRIAAFASLMRPLVCLAIFYAVVFGTHLSVFYDTTLRYEPVHELEHAAYLLAGAVLWWPVLDVDPVAARRLNGFSRLAYAVAAMLPMTLIGAFLYRHQTLVYAPYAAAARGLGISALTDQALGGAIMWVVGGAVMALVGLWQAMAALLAEERRLQSRERAGARAVERVAPR